jgi:DNA modification methylase
MSANACIYHDDCKRMLAQFPDNSIDSIVTDPPYELGFMGKGWDSTGIAYDAELWKECLRVLKPGGHLLSFSGTRTYHRMACAIEDAGFEIRDQLQWLYGTGMPKGLNVSKAIDKKLGATREVVGQEANWGKSKIEDGKTTYGDYAGSWDITTAGSEEAAKYEGWNTALKPACEPICMARKPMVGTVAENVLEHGTGAINVLDTRVNDRYPSNVLLDEDAATELGDASRFFYVSKASRKERDAGLEDGNKHPTVKPIDLMKYLCKMVTPENGIVLDPFMGSGTTAVAAITSGFRFVGMELDEHSCRTSIDRLKYWTEEVTA